jgi:hypothetical protein
LNFSGHKGSIIWNQSKQSEFWKRHLPYIILLGWKQNIYDGFFFFYLDLLVLTIKYFVFNGFIYAPMFTLHNQSGMYNKMIVYNTLFLNSISYI